MTTYATRHRAHLARQATGTAALEVSTTGETTPPLPDLASHAVPVPAATPATPAPVIDPTDRRPTGDIDQGSRGRGPIDPGRVRPSSAETRAALRALGLTPPRS